MLVVSHSSDDTVEKTMDSKWVGGNYSFRKSIVTLSLGHMLGVKSMVSFFILFFLFMHGL